MIYLLDEQYLEWLVSRIDNVKVRAPASSHWSLLKQLYDTEFVWFVPNDDNRVEDGRALRDEFFEETGLEEDREWLELGCSFLEMLLGLSLRMSFITDDSVDACFWHLMENLKLDKYTDARYEGNQENIADAVDTVIWRTYDRNGKGGLFPLHKAPEDQRETEIWYQMSSYILNY